MAQEHDDKQGPLPARDGALAKQDDSFWPTVTWEHDDRQAPAQEAVPKSLGNSFWPPTQLSHDIIYF